jgi:hypothetical protein
VRVHELAATLTAPFSILLGAEQSSGAASVPNSEFNAKVASLATSQERLQQ